MTDLRERLQRSLGDGYRVTGELGGGGMSRVFVAEDRELERKVVVKVLPPDLAAGLNVERFRREIQLAARLQHPHIVPLLAGGARDGLLYYTMPLIGGETLRAKLTRSGELPVADAVRIVRDIADALEYAHAEGVVHRDIKPENVLVSGHHALVTDFGVSKALSRSTGDQSLTSIGVALGTPAYMAPEQATADPGIDHRADIYALGVLAYELLAGRPPFSGLSAQQVLAAHVTEQPEEITKHRPNISDQLAQLIMRCLEKKPADRWQSAEEIRAQLEQLSTPSGGLPPADRGQAAGTRATRGDLGVVAGAAFAGLLVVAGVLLAALHSRNARSAPPFTVGMTRQLTNDPGIEITPAISPDGKFIAYAAGSAAETRIYVRQLFEGRPIIVAADVPGNQRMPRWSPNGSEIVFTTGTGIYVAPAFGGRARRIADTAGMVPRAFESFPLSDAAWSPDGARIAFADGGHVYIARSDGSDRRVVLDARNPHSLAWSPDGSRLAFVAENAQFVFGASGVLGNVAPSAIWVVGSDGRGAQAITGETQLNTSPVWTPDGNGILYVSTLRGGRDVYYQRLGRAGVPTGQPHRLTTGANAHGIALSQDGGTLVYATFVSTSAVWSMPIPGGGPVTAAAARRVTTANELIEYANVSADGEWLVFDSDRSGNQDIWKQRVSGSDAEQLTRDPADEFRPSWSMDGREVVFHSWRKGNRDLLAMSADGSGVRELAATEAHEYAGVWSPDGKDVAFPAEEDGALILHLVDRSGARRRLPHGTGGAGVAGLGLSWSPDGQWIATTRTDLLTVIRPLDSTYRVLAAPAQLGGAVPAEMGGFSPDSRTVYFAARDVRGLWQVWAAPIGGGNPRPVVLFDDPEHQPYRGGLSTDGKNFYFTIGKRAADLSAAELVQR